MALAVAAGLAAPAAARQTPVDAPGPPPAAPRVWPSEPPEPPPFPPSEAVSGLCFTGRRAEYTHADTWYPSWVSDGNLYSPWTDGNVNGMGCSSGGKNAATGHAKIVGDDPLRLEIADPGTYKSDPAPYGGRYPCGSLVYNGVWYYGTYCLMNEGGSLQGMVKNAEGTWNWGVLGPLVGFRWSADFGKTWTQTPHTPERPLFGEPAKFGGKVKFGSPHFVDFGRNMRHSPDGKAYLVGHGAVDPDPRPRPANLSWITGDQVYLCRVTPSVENINDASKYEFFAGRDEKGEPRWGAAVAAATPLVDWNNHCGCVTVTYDAPLKTYLMCVTDGWPTVGTMDTYVLESDRITGSWRLVTYMAKFGEQGYFVNFPSKFISADGRTAWLCYANNFTGNQKARPPGGRYGMCLQEVRLMAPGESPPPAPPAPPNPLASGENAARKAAVTASSVYEGYAAQGAVDGVVGGYPDETANEWASKGEGAGAWLRLEWPAEQTVDRVWLFDRPNKLDQVTSGTLSFSDGTSIETGALPDDAAKGLEVAFAARKIKWLVFTVTGVKRGSPNIGLAEIAVFRAAEGAAEKGP